MVCFQCECCGDTIKKPKADKHAQTCRPFRGYTCLDCHAFFPNAEYKAHTSCITEAEKYHGSCLKKKVGKEKEKSKMQTGISAQSTKRSSAIAITAQPPEKKDDAEHVKSRKKRRAGEHEERVEDAAASSTVKRKKRKADKDLPKEKKKPKKKSSEEKKISPSPTYPAASVVQSSSATSPLPSDGHTISGCAQTEVKIGCSEACRAEICRAISQAPATGIGVASLRSAVVHRLMALSRPQFIVEFDRELPAWLGTSNDYCLEGGMVRPLVRKPI